MSRTPPFLLGSCLRSWWWDGWIPPAWAIYETTWQSHSIFYNLPSKATIIFMVYHCLHKSAPFHVRGNYSRLWTTGGEGHWVPSWTPLSDHPSSIPIYSTYERPSLALFSDFKYFTCIYSLLFLTLPIPFYSLSHLLQCPPLHRNYFLDD